jgi:hypothetical protein
MGLLGFLPLSILIVVQSIFALDATFDTKLVIDADEVTVVDILMYDSYNNIITDSFDAEGEGGKPIMFTIVEATETYLIVDLHGGEVEDEQLEISGFQFVLSDGSKTELTRGIMYLQFKNVAMTSDNPDYYRDFWIRDFIEDMNVTYEVWFEQPAGTVSYVWVKIITASIGTLIGMTTVALVVLRKSTKALVKRYWRVSVLVALIEGTIILGLITWIIADIFQVFAAATVGWLMFLGAEQTAKHFGYIEAPRMAQALDEEVRANVEADVNSILDKYRK